MLKIKIGRESKDSMFDKALLKPKKILFPHFWKSDKTLETGVSEQLLEIAQDVVTSMDIKVKIKDFIITGSIASYNWHAKSDIDLHILLDFSEIDENFALVKNMLDQSRINWNKTHDIFIKGKEVEIYFQDINESHESAGIWSLKNSEWLVEPVLLSPVLDLSGAERKAAAIASSINHISDLMKEKKYKEAYMYSSKVKKKISNMRQAGLESEGIFSPENLAFKMLRNENYLDNLSNLKIRSYDKMMSVDLVSEVSSYLERDRLETYKYNDHPQASLDKLLDPTEPAPWD